MKQSIVEVWGRVSHQHRKINETTANTLREATTACLDMLVQSQLNTKIHHICAVGGLKRTDAGYTSEIRWSEDGAHWWTRQRKLILSAQHGSGYVWAIGDVYMPNTHMDVERLTEALAVGLAGRYVR